MSGGFTRHRRSGRVIANFSGFEADLLRSLAGQLVELLRNEAAQPRDDLDPFEAMMDFSGPTAAPEDPVLSVAVEPAEHEPIYRRMIDAGLEIVYPMTTEPWGVRRFFVRTPGGVVVNILEHHDA